MFLISIYPEVFRNGRRLKEAFKPFLREHGIREDLFVLAQGEGAASGTNRFRGGIAGVESDF
jgi:hypothetical protein